MKQLHDLLEEVNDSKSFLKFANALLEDRELQEGRKSSEIGFCGDWANNDIAGFLEAGIAWADDSEFGARSQVNISKNPWRQFATFLYCGKTYK